MSEYEMGHRLIGDGRLSAVENAIGELAQTPQERRLNNVQVLQATLLKRFFMGEKTTDEDTPSVVVNVVGELERLPAKERTMAVDRLLYEDLSRLVTGK
jgi:hypothetical protein